MPLGPSSSGEPPATDGRVLEDSDLAETAKILNAPVSPSAIEIETHNATRIPFRTWCKRCVSGRKPNPQHRRKSGENRDVPLLVGDYGFVRDSRDEDLLTMYVGRLYPSRAVVAFPVSQKGHDECAVHRLANFLRTCGY